jgi:hypothetical protein
MTTMTNSNPGMKMFRKLSFLMDEAVWQFALVGVIATALIDAAMSMGGSSIA